MENSGKENEQKVNENVIETEKETKKIEDSNIVLNENDVEVKKQQDLIKQYYINLQKQKYERFIVIVMNQTTYTREEAIAGLEKHKGNITLVIKEFLGAVDKTEEHVKEQNSKSLHQKRYGVIREYMDNASTQFMKKQEQEKRYKEFLERQKKAKELQQQQQQQQLFI